MTTLESDWYRSLAPELVSIIRNLYRRKRIWNLVAPLFLLAWATTGFLMMLAPHWALRLPGYFFIAMLMSGIANFMHEAVHGNVFRDRTKDRWFGVLMGLPVLLSFSGYRVTHLRHHKHTRMSEDPDEFLNISSNPKVLSVLYYVWLLVGTFVYMVYVPFLALRIGKPKEKRAVLIEYALLGIVWSVLVVSIIRFDQLEALVNVWAIPLVLAAIWINMRYWSEHSLTIPGHPLTETRTVTSNRLFSFLNLNMNYHLEHHLYPGIPWYNLPRTHKLLENEYAKASSSIYKSYAVFLFDALRLGVHGLAMSPQSRGEEGLVSSALHEEMEDGSRTMSH